MKKNVKVGITFTVLTALVLGIGIFFAILVNDRKTLLEDISTVKTTYTNFTGNTINIHLYRTSLDDKFNSYDETTYPEEHDTYVDLLTEYNEEIVLLNNNVIILEDKCAKEYDDAETNIFCSYYKESYEVANNFYVSQLTKYNKLITDYNQNEENEKDFDLFELINKDYVDFDQNGTFEGRE